MTGSETAGGATLAAAGVAAGPLAASTQTVLIEGYEGEPYARIDRDGAVAVNTDSKAYYLNQERDGRVAVPEGADSSRRRTAASEAW